MKNDPAAERVPFSQSRPVPPHRSCPAWSVGRAVGPVLPGRPCPARSVLSCPVGPVLPGRSCPAWSVGRAVGPVLPGRTAGRSVLSCLVGRSGGRSYPARSALSCLVGRLGGRSAGRSVDGRTQDGVTFLLRRLGSALSVTSDAGIRDRRIQRAQL